MSRPSSTDETQGFRWLRFVYLKSFEQRLGRLRLGDDFLTLFENCLITDPHAGKVMRETRGLRKLRVSRQHEGKRGGYRVCYVYSERYSIVFAVTIFAKNERDNLTGKERTEISKLIDRLENELLRGDIR